MFLLFDVESVPDALLLSQTKYRYKNITPTKALALARKEIMADSGRDFIPYTYQYPVVIGYAKVGDDYRLQLIGTYGTYPDRSGPGHYSEAIVREFWQDVVEHKPRLVSFNGRGFDLPLLELMAFKYGIAAPTYYNDKYGPRYRFGDNHIDLQEFITNFGASRLAGGLDLLSHILGNEGKAGLSGDMVLDLFMNNKIEQIISYCLNDVMATYRVFLRTRVLTGQLKADKELELIREAEGLS